MKTIVWLLPIFMLLGCNNSRPTTPATFTVPNPVYHQDKIKYSDEQLERFLDSIGQLPTQPFEAKTASYADSVFRHQSPFKLTVSPVNFSLLKRAALSGGMPIANAKSIFGNIEIDSIAITKGIVQVTYYPFDTVKNSFDQYALVLGDTWHDPNATLYFFKANHVIARHPGYSHYGLELQHYRNTDGKTIVYYKHEFDDGSGEWWNNFFFYKYDGDKLIPVLNELQNGNIQGAIGPRVKWLESFVQKTNPLTIKMVYYLQFPNSAQTDYTPRIVNDSTTVQYLWDQHSKTLQGEYQQSKISKAQILSYTLEDDELLFINAYHRELKKALHNKANRNPVLIYLNDVKNAYRGF